MIEPDFEFLRCLLTVAESALACKKKKKKKVKIEQEAWPGL